MASLALGAIGGCVFGPIGFAIGSAIGSMLFDQTKSEGPRLTDKRLQGSSYGENIARVYGTMVLGGQVIWAPDLTEHKHKTGGKGGPQVTTYTYTGSFDVLICESNGGAVVAGVQRSWFDGTLMYDTTGATTVDNSLIPVTFYYGDAGQLPDPTEEAVLGVGNVSAHRGKCRAVFADWDLGQFGNRIPTIKFQIFTAAGPWPYMVSPQAHPWFELNYDVPSFEMVDGEIIVTSTLQTTNTARWEKFDLQLNSLQGPVYTSSVDSRAGAAINSNDWVGLTPSTTSFFWESYDDVTGDNVQGADVSVDWINFPAPGNLAVCTGADKEFWFGMNNSNSPAVVMKYRRGGGFIDSVGLGGIALGSECSLGTSDGSQEFYVCYNGGGLSGHTELWKFDLDLNVLDYWSPAVLSATTLNAAGARGNFVVYKGRLAHNYQVGSVNYIAVVDLGPGIAANDPDAVLLEQDNSGRLADLGNGLIMNCNNGVFSMEPPASPVVLGAIVADQSDLCGLVPTQYPDLPGSLPDLVPGFMISRQASGVDNIAQLRAAYLFGAVESSGAMKFVKYGGAPVVTIPDEHLAAQVGGSGTPPPLVTVVRTPELELPATMYVNYFAMQADYQTGTQYSRRLVTRSQADARADLAIALTDQVARGISQKLLYMAWLERTKCTILVPRWYAYLEPTDVIQAHGYTFRVEHKSNVQSDIVQLEGVVTVSSSSSLFYSGSIGVSTGGNTTVTPPVPVASDFQLYDLPLVQDADAPNGVYAAMYPTIVGPWPGGTLYQSNDGGTTYNQVGTDSSQDVVGTVALALGDFSGKNVFDWRNPFEVVLSNGGTLASATRDAVLNGANACLVGSEILQFTTATLTAPYTYTLDGLLRGRRGTKTEIATHGTSERFLLLPSTINVAAPFAELGAARLYKGVTTGGALTGVLAKTFTNNGNALLCYAPEHLGGGRNGALDVLLHWQRCTRIGGTWLNFTDVPLGEATEQYYLKIWSDGTYSVLKSGWSPTTPEFEYTTAQQVIDFGSLQSTVYWTVQQLGYYGYGRIAYGVS